MHVSAQRRVHYAGHLLLFLVGLAGSARGQTYSIQTPAGPITIRLSHLAPSGSLIAPAAPEPETFRPPSIFSAPLPSGSGARALGLGGAFTALADDATAASWNPAGLIQLERPEASVVYRWSEDKARHFSGAEDFHVGEDKTRDDHLNYFSADYPFQLKHLDRNLVVALNYQEAYDFSQSFHARLLQDGSSRARDRESATYRGTQVDHIRDDVSDVTVYSHETTVVESTLNQLLRSDLVSDLSFAQEGIISAITPALAVEITPKLSFGLSANLYQIDPFGDGDIQSVTHARYSGKSRSQVTARTTRTTSGTYDYDGTVTLPPDAEIPFPIVVPINGSGAFEPFSDSRVEHRQRTIKVDGTYTEINTFEDLEGQNATLGLLYTVNRLVTLGLTVDLPWTADARQTKTIQTRSTIYNETGTRVLDRVHEDSTTAKDVSFDFPLYWAAGAVLRWTPQFYTTLDLSQTRWSDFSFQAAGESAINPLDGSPQSDHPLDDTWAARCGLEYLILFQTIEIPLRAGFAWEERPALGAPDDYYSFTAGSGIGIGKEPRRTILDFAYVYTFARDVRGIVPSEATLRSDIEEHDFFVSIIQHF